MPSHRSTLTLTLLLLAASSSAVAQVPRPWTHADTLRGFDGPGRAWWDVGFYDLHVQVRFTDSTLAGWNAITYRVLEPRQELQLDLQAPLVLDSVVQDRRRLTWRQDGDAFFVALRSPQRAGTARTLTAYYHGRPGRLPTGATARPRGSWAWYADSTGAPWFTTSNELTGASIWWPLKDYLGDEPDSQRIAITAPDPLVDVSNGRLRSTTHNSDHTTTWEWFLTEPINTYDVTANIGPYVHLADSLDGEGGKLSLDFWPIAAHRDTARAQWQQAKPMLRCFEQWFGPYPWYADGYKLIETPYLGMEHQSGIAYGNRYLTGYLGRDLSGTGLGLNWDYIVIHESAHEWWGNSVTARQYADLFVHESFATYAEGLYTECQRGPTAGAAYLIGLRRGIRNTQPIIGPAGMPWYHGDIYSKGANVLHTIRQLVGDDWKWRMILRGIQREFRHQTVTGQQVLDYLNAQAGVDLSAVFTQYLTTTKIPEFQYHVEGTTLSYRWAGVVPGFAMSVRVNLPGEGIRLLKPTPAWQTLTVTSPEARHLVVDENYYVTQRETGGADAP
ncbi:MAG: M1 family metallopeptidase [Gemmatimonadales bacterium]